VQPAVRQVSEGSTAASSAWQAPRQSR
jgi:hypothetical protein